MDMSRAGTDWRPVERRRHAHPHQPERRTGGDRRQRPHLPFQPAAADIHDMGDQPVAELAGSDRWFFVTMGVLLVWCVLMAALLGVFNHRPF